MVFNSNCDYVFFCKIRIILLVASVAKIPSLTGGKESFHIHVFKNSDNFSNTFEAKMSRIRIWNIQSQFS